MRSFLVILALIGGSSALAELENTSVLPVGVWSPRFIYGNIGGLSERFNADGEIESATAKYRLDLNGTKVGNFIPELKELISELNQLSPGLGQKISWGTLDFRANPVVNYFAPTLAYGLTKNISLGFGIPILNINNEVEVVTGGVNNASQVQQSVKNMSSTLDSKFDMVMQKAADIPGTLQALLVARGYEPLRKINTTVPGDLTVSAVYAYYSKNNVRLALRPFVQLPTGQKDNPDDFVDIPTGGQQAVGLYSNHEYYFSPQWVLGSSLGYQANLQDELDVRVPTSSDDKIPDKTRKDKVRRKTGNSIFLEAGVRYSFAQNFVLGSYYDFTVKDPDWFDGDRGWDYSALSKDTGGQRHTIHGLFEFSTVPWYTQKTYKIPFIVGYTYAQNLYGVNSPKQIVHQFYLRTFF